MARAFTLGGLPNTGLPFNAPHPPRRYCASHPYIVRRLILKDRATTSGFSPACTLRTARIRIASSVAWSSLRASSCFMPQGIMPDSARQEGSATIFGPINNGLVRPAGGEPLHRRRHPSPPARRPARRGAGTSQGDCYGGSRMSDLVSLDKNDFWVKVVKMQPRFVTEDMVTLRLAALRGVGVVRLPMIVIKT